MPEPRQKPGSSKQDYRTPRELLDAVEQRFGPIHFDLAATAQNAVAPAFFCPEQDSLLQDWNALPDGLLWLNPPFANIAVWAKKCAETCCDPFGGKMIAFLTPASVGSEWFRLYVHGQAYVLALSPRLTFMGERCPYPKDCILSLFGHYRPGFNVWRWKP